LINALKNSARAAVQRLFATQGVEVRRRRARNGAPIPLLKLVIEHSLLRDGPGAILQVGANDGLYDDPVHEIISEHGVAAILVEPLPDLFAKLVRNYEGRENIRFENCAVGAQAGEATIYRIKAEATHLPEWAQALASFDKSVLLKHRESLGLHKSELEKLIEVVRVPVVTIAELVKKHPQIGRFVALQVDTEGHDFVIVKSAVEGGFLPPVIGYEHRHLNYADQAACRELLAAHGYAFWTGDFDTLAYRDARPGAGNSVGPQ
jgi:FkbM family methyltransferase